MKTNLLLLFLISVLFSNAQNWVDIGATNALNASDAGITVNPVTGEPYIAYANATDGNKTYVSKWDGSNWVQIGGALNTDDSFYQTIAFHPTTNNAWVCFLKKTENRLRVYELVGNTWTYRLLNAAREVTLTNERPRISFSSTGVTEISKIAFSSISSNFFIEKIINNPNTGNWESNGQTYNTGASNVATVNRDGVIAYNFFQNNNSIAQLKMGTTPTDFSANITPSFNKVVSKNNYWVGYLNNSTGLIFGENDIVNTSQPLGSINSQTDYLYIDKSSNQNLNLMYSDTSNELKFETFNTESQQWNNSIPNLIVDTTASNFFVNATMAEIDNYFYIVYKTTNGETAVKRFEPLPALTRYYVDANATGDGSGDSWANAMTNLDFALAEADSNTSEIWIAEGTYRTAANVTNGFSINLDNISIYGGFNGTETAISQRNIRDNETIFSGDASNNDNGVGYGTTGRNENARQVILINANDVSLDGITIADGHADGTTTASQIGAAIYINPLKTNFTLRNATVKNNVSFAGGNLFYWPETSGSITIENCIFKDNISRYGSSAYILTDTGVNLTALILNNIFYNNEVKDRGSVAAATGDLWIRAIDNNSLISTNVLNCTFANFSSNGTNSSLAVVHAPLVLSQNSGNHVSSVTNSIIYGNNVITGKTLFDISGRSTGNVANVINVTNSIGEEGFSLASSTTNTVSSNPLFMNPLNGDFTLSTGSPAIDSGDNAFLTFGTTNITTDLNFNSRVYNTTVDMGAFEYNPTLSTTTFETSINPIIYPNPASNEIKIKTQNQIKAVTIYNVLGEKVLQGYDNTINISHLTNGTYLVNIIFENGNNQTKKIIKL